MKLIYGSTGTFRVNKWINTHFKLKHLVCVIHPLTGDPTQMALYGYNEVRIEGALNGCGKWIHQYRRDTTMHISVEM